MVDGTEIRRDGAPGSPKEGAWILPITQASAASFSDIFMQSTFLCFIQAGSKRVQCPINGEVIGEEGDVLIFPSGAFVTLENRPLPRASYRADGLYFENDLVEAVFDPKERQSQPIGIQHLRAGKHRPAEILDLVRDTLENPALPAPIRKHRLLEPLIWLRHHGIRLPVDKGDRPILQVRRLIDTDPARPWHAPDVARHFAMSEASFRRWLARAGQGGFARILQNTRLEKGLLLLQTTDRPISAIALDCGFKTPSHFSDAFKKRFGLKPMAIRSAVD